MVVLYMALITVAASLTMMDTLLMMRSIIKQGVTNLKDSIVLVIEIMTILVIIMEAIVATDMDHSQDIQMTFIMMKETEGNNTYC